MFHPPTTIINDDAVLGVQKNEAGSARPVDPDQRYRVSKFPPCLPAGIDTGFIAREAMNVEDANATLAQGAQASTPETEA